MIHDGTRVEFVRTALVGIAMGLLLCSPHTARADTTGQTSATDTRGMLRYLTNGMQSNLDKLTSGRGTLSWSMSGEYFGAGEGTEREFTAEFSFQGEKLKYRRVFSDDRRPTTIVIDGEHLYEYLYYPWRDETSDPPDVYIREGETYRGGEFHGEVIDLKRMMKPKSGRIEQLLAAADEGSIAKSPDGTYAVTATETGRASSEYRYWFDPAVGFQIIREQLLYNDRLLDDVERTFEQRDGMWVLKSLSQVRYAHDGPPTADQAPRVVGRSQVAITSFMPNADVSPDEFTIRGMDLPPRTQVWDTIKNVNYMLDSNSITHQYANELPPVGQATDTPPRSPFSFGQEDSNASLRPVRPEPGARPAQSPRREVKQVGSASLRWMLGLLGVCLAGGALLVILRRRRRE